MSKNQRVFALAITKLHINEGHFQDWRETLEVATSSLPNTLFHTLNLTDLQVDFTTSLRNSLVAIKSEYPNSKIHIHHEWAHDLSFMEINQISSVLAEFDVTWSTHVATSQALRRKTGAAHRRISELMSILSQQTNLVNLWTWDTEFHNFRFKGKTLLGLEDRQATKVDLETCVICRDNAVSPSYNKISHRGLIGLVGQLYGYRGVDLVVNLALFNPDRKFLLAGKLMPESLKISSYVNLVEKPLPNIILRDEYFEKSESLNHILCHLSALVIDTKRYPEPSGIATRALVFGVQVLINDMDSHLGYLSTNEPLIRLIKKKFMRGYDLKNYGNSDNIERRSLNNDRDVLVKIGSSIDSTISRSRQA